MTRERDFVDECYKDKDLGLLKKLTLVIPTYDRNYYLSRCLWYHAHFPFGQIIVADSSPEEKKSVNRDTVAKINSLFDANVVYLEYQPETEKYGGDIYRKWRDAVQYVETEYSMLCTDKEFLIPSVGVQCLFFLDENPDYVSAGAKKYSICLKGLRPISKNKNNYHLIQRKPNRESESGVSVLDRLNSAFVKEQGFNKNLLLTISRSWVQKYVFDLLQNYSIDDIRYGELILAYGAYLFGKFHYVGDDIYKVRDIIYFNLTRRFGNHVPSKESSNTRYPYLSSYFKDETCNEFSLRFKACVSGELEKHADISRDKAESIVIHYLTESLLLKYDSGNISLGGNIYSKSHIIHGLFDVFPFSFKRAIMTAYNKIVHKTVCISPDLSSTYSNEIDIISELIVSTVKNEESDTPVTYIQ